MSAFAHHALEERKRDMRFRSRDERREKLCAALEAEEWIEQDSGILSYADVRLDSRQDPGSSFPTTFSAPSLPTTTDRL